MKLPVLLLVLCFGSWTSGDDAELRKEPSKRLLTFLALVSGQVTNLKEVNMEYTDWGETEHDVIVGSFRHVFVPALPNEIVLLMQESVNAVLYRLQILIVREGDLGIISLEPHNFTNINKYNSTDPFTLHPLNLTYPVPGYHTKDDNCNCYVVRNRSVQFDVTKDFDNVSLDDLSPTRPECEFFFMQTDVNVFVGTMPDCKHFVNGRPVNYATTFSCKTMAVLLYAEQAREVTSPLPYTNRFTTRYPLLPYVTSGAENFLPPCNCQ